MFEMTDALDQLTYTSDLYRCARRSYSFNLNFPPSLVLFIQFLFFTFRWSGVATTAAPSSVWPTHTPSTTTRLLSESKKVFVPSPCREDLVPEKVSRVINLIRSLYRGAPVPVKVSWVIDLFRSP